MPLCQCDLCQYTNGQLKADEFRARLKKHIENTNLAIKSTEFEKEEWEFEKQAYERQLEALNATVK